METKVCSKCGIEKEVCEFHKGKTKDGYQYRCKLCKKEYSKLNVVTENNRKILWSKNNPDKIKESKKKYYNNNVDKEQFRNNAYCQNKKKHDVVFKLTCITRTRLNEFLKIKNITKKNKTFNYVGCSPQFLKDYLEKQFTEGMDWSNHGLYGWHIDHVIPLSSANTEEEMYKLCHYTNLQPLWAFDNLSKGCKM